MNIQTQILEDQQARLTVEVDPAQLEGAKRRAATRIARKVKIPGFRPGKAPYAVILRTVGEAGILEEAMELLVDDIYPQVIKESGIDPYGPGRLESIASMEPPTFVFLVPLVPEVTLGDYRSIRSPYELPTVTESDVDDVLQELRERQAVVEPVERPAQVGDQVVVNFSASRLNAEPASEVDATESEDPAAEDQDSATESQDSAAEAQDSASELQDSAADDILIPERSRTMIVKEDRSVDEWPFSGFSHELIGLSAGDEKQIEYTYPDDAHQEVYQGVQALFDLKVDSIKSHTLPDLTDEFASSVGDFENMDALRSRVFTSLQEQKHQEYNEQYDEEILKQSIEQSVFKYPPQMLENEVEQVLHDLTHRLEHQNLDIDLYKKARGLDDDGLRAELKPVAEQRLQRSLFLYHLGRTENIEVSRQEVEQESINLMNYLYSTMPEKEARKLMQQDVRDNLVANVLSDLLSRRAMERLRDIASGRQAQVEAEAAAAEAAAETSEPAEDLQTESTPQPEAEPAPAVEDAAPQAGSAPAAE